MNEQDLRSDIADQVMRITGILMEHETKALGSGKLTDVATRLSKLFPDHEQFAYTTALAHLQELSDALR